MLKIKAQVFIPYDVIKNVILVPNGVKINYRDGSNDFFTLAHYEIDLLAVRLENWDA